VQKLQPTVDANLRQGVFLGLMKEGMLTIPNQGDSLSTTILQVEVDPYLEALRRILVRWC